MIHCFLHVPSGTAIASPVLTSPLPLAGIVIFIAQYISYPAANADPRVGARASGTNFFTKRGGGVDDWETDVTAAAADSLTGDMELVLMRFARGELGRDGG